MRKDHTALAALAKACGIQTAYRDMNGRFHRASSEILISTIRAMGIGIKNTSDAIQALERLKKERLNIIVEPVIVAWNGRRAGISLALSGVPPQDIEAELRLESGETRRLEWKDIARYAVKNSTDDGSVLKVRLPLKKPLPWGYHRLDLSVAGASASTLLISTPPHVFTPAGGPRRWGLFCPLYAVHSGTSWGAGDVGDLEKLAEFNASLGGSVIATLPLLPVFLKEHFNPSPYSPVSRLYWNELYINVEAIPELADCPEAAELLRSAEFKRELDALRALEMVDYARQSSLKRRILELLAEDFFQRKPSGRWKSFTDYLAIKPDLERYCRFRAFSEERRVSWRDWPEKLRNGSIEDSDCRPELLRYYLYTQFIAHEQMADTTAHAHERGQAFYLDLSLGTHPDGYDVWREQSIFALGTSVGAPPDPAFSGGQNWGFPPLHPQRQRESGYKYAIEVLRHHLRFAGILRLDHIMGLHRLFWIPPGLKAADGIYVRYEAEEMYAILCLEAHRQRAVIVGEDLGLVPREVRRAMRRRHIYRSYVAQYEMVTGDDDCLEAAPSDSVAALNTHDMHPFTAFWEEEDIAERQAVGVLKPEQASAEKQQRRAGKSSLLKCLSAEGRMKGKTPATEEVCRVVTETLAESPSEVLLVNIADLTGERRAQNIPGTYQEHANWRRKTKLSLEEFESAPEIAQFLKKIDRIRKKVPDAPPKD